MHDSTSSNMFYGAAPYIFEKARELRQDMTKAEKVLWEQLKKKQLNGYKFRRQHPVFEYVADFYCHAAKIVIELDGSYHNLNEAKIKDYERTKIMNKLGIEVLRFYNGQVINETNAVLNKIKRCLEERT